jgi:hypothetical protein
MYVIYSKLLVKLTTQNKKKMEHPRKARKAKDINFIDKKTFRLGQDELDNLAEGSKFFQEQQSDYIRRLLQIPPKKVKTILNALEEMEGLENLEE